MSLSYSADAAPKEIEKKIAPIIMMLLSDNNTQLKLDDKNQVTLNNEYPAEVKAEFGAVSNGLKLSLQVADLKPGQTLNIFINGHLAAEMNVNGVHEFNILEDLLNSTSNNLLEFKATPVNATWTVSQIELLNAEGPFTRAEAADFLIAATFGPTDESVTELLSLGYSAWFTKQLNLPMKSVALASRSLEESSGIGEGSIRFEKYPKEVWFEFAVKGQDQLRQRVAFALSQIFAVSTSRDAVAGKTWMHTHYMDIIQDNSFGDFRGLLQEITYSPFMADWLTYMNNSKANPETGSEPDENYAREVMQLFTIGLVELNSNGTEKEDSNGNSIDSYDLEDVTELSKVFTGLHRSDGDFGRSSSSRNQSSDITPIIMSNEDHSRGVKNVLGEVIPDYADGNNSISHALDILVNHPNTAPFISKQMIQRLTTSNPSPEYVEEVANAFTSGSYILPNGSNAGSGKYGDLKATVAAILLNSNARTASRLDNTGFGNTYGKVREPILRLMHWARVSGVSSFVLRENFSESWIGYAFGQNFPYRASSVFNFFRPGYVAAGTETAEAGLVAPEMQIEFGSGMTNYANAMRVYIISDEESGTFVEVDNAFPGFYPDYDSSGLISKAADTNELVDYLNLILTANRMHPTSLEKIKDNVSLITKDADDYALSRVQEAMMMFVNTVEFKTQQ